MALKVYNSLTQSIEPFEPRKDNEVNMFVCGPTVYDRIHLGNARTFTVFDVVAKWLRECKYDLTYIQNITDIDDKIIGRAHDEGTTPKKIAQVYTTAFLEDMEALGVRVDKYAKASEYIEQIVAQVQKLITRGYAYAVPGLEAAGPGAVKGGGYQDVYFDIEKYEKDFPNRYGKLSGIVVDNLEAEKRVEMEKNKRHSRDFVLWKAQNYSFDWTTDSPWGKGRPGWHIEDTAITESFFGPQYDLHGGGMDLKFPHHEAEIAQQEAASGKMPFVKYWMHAGFLENKNEKMSKSLGNFMTLRAALNKYEPEVLRFYFLGNHYRAPLDFSDKALDTAQAAVQRIYEAINKVNNLELTPGEANPEIHKAITQSYAELTSAMDDDFNTARAFAAIFDAIRAINIGLAKKSITEDAAKEIRLFFSLVSRVFGVIPAKGFLLTAEADRLKSEREEAREQKDFLRADQLRDRLAELGYTVDDTPYGSLVKKK